MMTFTPVRSRLAVPAVLVTLLLWGSAPAGQQPPTVSADLAQHPRGPHMHRVIVQAGDAGLAALRRGGTGLLRRELRGAVALEVNDDQLEALKRNSGYAHISGDLPVTTDMAVTNQVTRATAVWQGTPALLGLLGTPGYTGTGVGIAIVDSGIAPHTALDTRVVAHVSFVSSEPGTAGDPFGHGTHIAGIAAGNRTAASLVTPAYGGGSAPSARLIDVRVLNSLGSGLTSDVIAGIDWAVDHKTAYGIRVINLSLGHPITEPSATDPLCQAVLRAVSAGITVVVAAGNYGVTSTGEPVLGGITSPGNSPLAVTVGAIDTNGTPDASDDVVAPYSSKGPTRYDFAVKPDVVAPGTRIVSLEAQNSYISRTYPQWHVAGSGKNAYLRLTGTSMATAVVTGGVALLLNAQPTLTPAQVKMSLQMGAHFMPAAGLMGAGTGSVDFAQALKIAQNGLVTNLTTTVTSLLGPSSGAAFRDYGTLVDRIYDRTGIRLLNLLDFGLLFRDADGAEAGVLNLLGTSNPLGSTAANYIVWGSVADWSSSYYIVWGSTIATPSGQYIVWGSNDVSDGSYIVWGSSRGGGR